MEWKNYDQDSRVFPAILTSMLCVGVRGDAREVQDRVLALNGVIWMYMPEIMHASKPTEVHLTPCVWRRGNHSILGEGLGVGKELPEVLPESPPWCFLYLNYGAIFSFLSMYLTNWGTLGRFPNFSKSQFLQLQNGVKNSNYLMEVITEYMKCARHRDSNTNVVNLC